MKYLLSLYLLFFCIITVSQAAEFISEEQVQADLFPAEPLTSLPLKLSDETRDALEDKSGVHEPFNENRVWKTATGSFLVIDEVVGKHEKIKYAVALSNKGIVKLVKILTYNETYGYEVRKPKWLAQFIDKTPNDPLKLNGDIKNINGATLSSKHMAQGVKRVLALYELVLQKQ